MYSTFILDPSLPPDEPGTLRTYPYGFAGGNNKSDWRGPSWQTHLGRSPRLSACVVSGRGEAQTSESWVRVMQRHAQQAVKQRSHLYVFDFGSAPIMTTCYCNCLPIYSRCDTTYTHVYRPRPSGTAGHATPIRQGGPAEFTPEIEVFYMLFYRSHSIFSITSLKHHKEYFHFRHKIQFIALSSPSIATQLRFFNRLCSYFIGGRGANTTPSHSSFLTVLCALDGNCDRSFRITQPNLGNS